MNKIQALLSLVAIGSFLVGCGSTEQWSASEKPLSADYSATYDITLERELLVDLNDPDTDSAPEKLSEMLRLVYHVQPVSGHNSRYRVEFIEVQASRTDFLHEVVLNDPVDELAGQSFEIHIDQEGQIVKADAFVETLKTLARGCETCSQGHDCGQRRLREQNFLLDVWAIQELLFRAARASQSPAQADAWTHTRQLPSALPGKAPSVITQWNVNTDNTGRVIAGGYESLDSNSIQNTLPELFHPHIRPKGLLGYLRNCTYETIDGHITLEADASSGFPVQLTREAAMNAAAFYTLSRLPQRPSITVWETLNVRQSPVLSSAKIHLTAESDGSYR